MNAFAEQHQEQDDKRQPDEPLDLTQAALAAIAQPASSDEAIAIGVELLFRIAERMDSATRLEEVRAIADDVRLGTAVLTRAAGLTPFSLATEVERADRRRRMIALASREL